MGFLPGVGYGNMESYTRTNIQADGFEVKNIAGTIMRKAFGELVFSRFINPSQNSFGLGRGGTFTIPIFKDFGAIATVQPLTSGTAITIGTQNTDSVQMMIQEFGTGIGYETQGQFFTNIAVQQGLTDTLGNHIARMVNWLDFNVLINSAFSIEVPSAGSYSNLLGTNRAGINQATLGEFGQGGLALLYDSFRNSIASPVTDRGMYVIIGNSGFFRMLKNGSVFMNVQLWSDMRGLRWQVLGEFMNFLAVETEENMTKGTGIAIALNAAGYGFGQLPKTYYYPDYGQDAGRLEVWKTLFYRGQGAIFRDKGTAAIVVRANTSNYNYGSMG